MLKTAIIALCSSGLLLSKTNNTPAPASIQVADRDTAKAAELLDYADDYLGKRYKYGGTGKGGFDCSGFVMHCFEKFGCALPHTSEGIAFMGKFVSNENACKGDLVFFTGRNSNSENVGHVGIVTECKNGNIYFIHASVQAGVIISHTGEDYYSKRFMFVKRVPL